MNIRSIVLFLFAAACTSTSVLAAEQRPNIVVFLCDDLGYGDLGCYGHPHIKTPNLDKMAADGIRLTDCYSSAPVCSPSRVGLLTGRSPNRAGVYDWIPPGNKPRPDAREQVHMQKSEITVAHLLKKAGYATAQSGKWHCNSQFNAATQPQPGDAGFDHWFATQNNASPSHRNPKNFVRNGEPVGPLEGYSCQLVVDEAMTWLERRKGGADPFFLFVAFHEPHEPVASPPDMVAEYKAVACCDDEAEYFANVANVDRAVGRMLKKLDDLGCAENTLVIFTSDNGPETHNRYKSANRSLGRPDPLRGMKLWTTDAGFRVAGIMRWPARIRAGQVSSTPVSALDFLPTFCGLAEAALPEGRALDGINFMPAVQGENLTRSKPLVWAYYNAINERRVAMRDGDWKVLAKVDLPMLQNVHDGNVQQVKAAQLSDVQIYKISDDIGEAKDRAAEQPERAAELGKKLEQEYRALLKDSHVWTRAN
jgi:arylsulfatase A